MSLLRRAGMWMLTMNLLLSFGCTAHRQKLIIENFTSSGSLCWDAMVVNQASGGCTSVTIEEHYGYKLYYCQTYSEGSDPADPWLVNNFYIIEAANSSMEPIFNQPVFPICSDATLMILYGEKVPAEPELELKEHPRLD